MLYISLQYIHTLCFKNVLDDIAANWLNSKNRTTNENMRLESETIRINFLSCVM